MAAEMGGAAGASSIGGALTGNVLKLGPWGGAGGMAWEWDGPIQKILVKHGSVVDSITFGATNDGVTKWFQRCGGTGGGSSEMSIDHPEEYLIAIRGSTGLFRQIRTPIITSLSFISNKRSYGPYGSDSGNLFSSTPMNGWKIVGFFGKCGTSLDAIGIKLVPFDLLQPTPHIHGDGGMEKDSIFRIPRNTRDRNPTAYTPNMVSIGPYHHNQPHLQNMSDHKLQAFQRLISRSKKSIGDFTNELGKVLPELKDSYQHLDIAWNDDDKFLWLMICDGAFLWEYMQSFSHDAYDPNSMVPNTPDIIRDLIMIENQLPLKVLERLIAVVEGQLEEEHYQVVYRLVFDLLGCSQDPQLKATRCLHLLDVARKAITKDSTPRICTYRRVIRVQPASNLSKVGVAFRLSTRQGRSEITLDQGSKKFFCFGKGYWTLNLAAPLWIDTFTEALFLNSIAFEQLHSIAGLEVNCYVAFVSGLICSEEDVGFLTSQGLIDRRIEVNDADVAKLISTISENVIVDQFSNLCEIRDSLNTRYSTKMEGLRQGVRKWTQKAMVFAFTGGALVLGLTIVQSIYTVLAYYKDN